MLAEPDKERIRAEEVFRQEVARSLKVPLSRVQKLFTFLNSSLGLWLLSAVFLSGFSAAYSHWRDHREAQIQRERMTEKLLIEIDHRNTAIDGIIDQKSVTFTQHNFAKGALTGVNEVTGKLGEVRDFYPVFPEYEHRTLYALVTELAGYEPDKGDDTSLKACREELLAIQKLFPSFRVIRPAGAEDSIWALSEDKRTEMRERWKRYRGLFAKRR